MADEETRTRFVRRSKLRLFFVEGLRALSQLALTFYVLVLLVALFATSRRNPGFALMMGILAVVPVICGPRSYRVAGIIALTVAVALFIVNIKTSWLE